MTLQLLNANNSSLFGSLELAPYTPLRGVLIALAVTTAAIGVAMITLGAALLAAAGAIIFGVALLSGSALLIAAAVLCR